MKKLLTITWLFFVFFNIKAQSTYSEAIEQGDAAFVKGDYKSAINKYFAAEAFEPSKRATIKEKLNSVYDKIESLRKEAENAKYSALKSEKKALFEADFARKQEQLVKKEKAKNDTLISRMIFFNNRAWVFNLNSKCALIDNLGNLVTGYEFSNPGFLPNFRLFTGYDNFGNYCLIDSTGQILIKTEYVMPCNNNSFLVKSHNFYTIIPFDFNWDNLADQLWYSSIGNFCEGYALAKLNDKFYLINEYGKLQDYQGYDEAYDFHENRAWVRFGDEWVVIKINKPIVKDTLIRDEKKQFIKTTITYDRFSTQKITIIQRDGLESRDTVTWGRFSKVKEFHNETSWVKDKDRGLWGKVNMQGIYVVPPEFDSIELINKRFSKIILNGKSGVMDDKNEIIIKPVYDDVEFWVDSIFRVTNNNQKGCIDIQGNILFEPKYENVYQFCDSTFLVYINDKYGWADINGNLIIDTIYSGGYTFENGRGVAYLNNAPYIINKKGELLHKLPYTNTSGFSEGLLWVANDGLWGLIDTTMTELIPPMFFEVRDFNNNEAWVKQYLGWGLITKDNSEFIIPPLFDDFWYSGRGDELWVKAGIKWGTLNKNGGGWIISPQFDKVYDDIYGNVYAQIGYEYFIIDKFGQIIIR